MVVGRRLAALSLIVAPLALHAQTPQPQPLPLTTNDRLNGFLHDEFSPIAMASVMLGAGVSTINQSPHFWDKDEGFGYRLGTDFAAHTADMGVRDGLAAVMHQDTHYAPCQCRNVFARAGHAVAMSVLARNERGQYVLGVPQIVGGYAGGLTTAGLYGHNYGWQGGLRLGTESLASHAGWNLVKEFVGPLLKRH